MKCNHIWILDFPSASIELKTCINCWAKKVIVAGVSKDYTKEEWEKKTK